MRIRSIKLAEMGPFKELDLTFPECGNAEHAEVHIFTGPNGCGKSSLLYGLAAIFRHNDDIEKRFWQQGAHPHLQVSLDREKKPIESFLVESPWDVYLGKPDEPMLNSFKGVKSYQRKNKTSLYRHPPEDKLSELFSSTDGYNDAPTNWAAFSYAGRQATLAESRVNTIDELKQGPFAEAMSFQQGPDELLKWIALMTSKAAIEQGNGNDALAERYRKPLRQLETALGSMLDQPVKFKVQTTPFSVALSVGGRTVDAGVLPDGVKSFLGWLGDLVSRLDRVIWKDDRDIFSQNFLLFLDEIDLHMHPSWQRKVLRVVQQLFPNAQIFCSTHSPFVVNSVDNAVVHRFQLNNGLSQWVSSDVTSEGRSVENTLSTVFDTKARFGLGVEEQLDLFYKARAEVLGGNDDSIDQLVEIAKDLVDDGPELKQIIAFELRQLSRVLGKEVLL